MLLENFRPRSRLVTRITSVNKPKFPVVDAHNHLGDPFGGGWDKKPLRKLLDLLDEAGVTHYVDLDGGWLHVRNKIDLGWRVKTGQERSVPLPPEVVAVRKAVIGGRRAGPVFLREKLAGRSPVLRSWWKKPGTGQPPGWARFRVIAAGGTPRRQGPPTGGLPPRPGAGGKSPEPSSG